MFFFLKRKTMFLFCTKSKKYFLNISLFLAYKKIKECVPPVAGFKKVLKVLYGLILG